LKNKNINTLIIIVITIFTFISIISQQHAHKNKNETVNLIDVAEKNNNYVIQNSLISSSNLNKIIDEQDVRMVYIQSNDLPSTFIPDTRIIPFKKINIVVDGISKITSKTQIEKLLREAGIDNDDIIIIYDLGNSYYATRLFWTLKVYGHENVKILNGGLINWISSGYDTVNKPITPENSTYFSLDKNEQMIATIEHIKEAIKDENEVILDVRSKKEYDSGHIPTAVNIPYTFALDNQGLFRKFETLQKIYHPLGITPDRTTIYVYCNRGNQSSFTYFVLQELLGYNNVVIYDGSFNEYVQTGLPIEK